MDHIIVKSEGKTYIVRFKQLLAIEVDDYLCKFYIEDEYPFSCVESLQKILLKLPEYFIRISRNCVINTLYVKSIDFKRREVKLSGNKTFGFSVRNAKQLKQRFSN